MGDDLGGAAVEQTEMMKTFGFDKLKQQAAEYANDIICENIEEATGESEIEKLLFAALKTRSWLGATEYNEIMWVRDAGHEERLLKALLERKWPYEDRPGAPYAGNMLLIRPQAEIKTRRVDFLIHALDWHDMNKLKWRRLIIECDGHDFHERTKEQAKRDRSRDREAVMADYDCFRFTGSEIWTDPWGCAEQITDWAVKGWGN
jgi:very-short-patch-repair endonuclease